MELDIFIAVLHGLIAGTVLGCVPGLGVLAGVLFSLPWLPYYSMMAIVLFYLSLIISSQYTGSIVATYFGIPGELTSATASKVGYALQRRGQGNQAIIGAAMGSMLATIISIMLVHFSVNFLSQHAWIHHSAIYLGIMLFVVIYLAFINQYWLLNMVLIILGLVLGGLGNKHGLQEFNFAFGQEWLEQGLIVPLIVIVSFVIPNLWIENKETINSVALKKIAKPDNTMGLNWYLFLKTKWSIMRGTLIGCISGLIPGVGTSISSNMSWGVEKSIHSSPMRQLVAAESANNSAMITSLIPLILFGVPILASESLILEILESHGESVDISWFTGFYNESNFSRLELFSVSAFVISFIMYFMSTNFAVRLTRIISIIPNNFFRFLLPISMVMFFVLKGYLEYQLVSTLFTILLCLPIMLWAIRKKINTLPLVFTTLLTPPLLERGSVVVALFTNIW